jgi:hypothetical protein
MLKGLEVVIKNHTSSRTISRTQCISFSPIKDVIKKIQIIVLTEGQDMEEYGRVIFEKSLVNSIQLWLRPLTCMQTCKKPVENFQSGGFT